VLCLLPVKNFPNQLVTQNQNEKQPVHFAVHHYQP
jgi:hypothetical protein